MAPARTPDATSSASLRCSKRGETVGTERSDPGSTLALPVSARGAVPGVARLAWPCGGPNVGCLSTTGRRLVMRAIINRVLPFTAVGAVAAVLAAFALATPPSGQHPTTPTVGTLAEAT